MFLNKLPISCPFHLKKEGGKKVVRFLYFSSSSSYIVSFSTKCVLNLLLPTFWALFTDFKTQQRDKGHSHTSQKLIKLQPNQAKWLQQKVENVSRWVSVGCRRPVIKRDKPQSFSTAVQTRNHKFEQKGLLDDLCQKLGAGTLLEDAMAVPRCTNQTQRDSSLVTYSSSLHPEIQ